MKIFQAMTHAYTYLASSIVLLYNKMNYLYGEDRGFVNLVQVSLNPLESQAADFPIRCEIKCGRFNRNRL